MKVTIFAIFAIFVAVLAVIFPIYMSYRFRGWFAIYDSPCYSFNDIPNLKGKVALITGVNTGYKRHLYVYYYYYYCST
jgi:hypothetical protein